MNDSETYGEKEEIFAVPIGTRKIISYRDSKVGTVFTKEKIVNKLRACLSCRVLLNEQQYYESGCPNCPHLAMEHDRHRITTCTTSSYNGMITVLKPQRSWAARYNKLVDVVPGCYAVSAHGEIPDEDRPYNDDY